MSNRGFIIVEPIHGFCGVGCFMGIMNYYYCMALGTKDTYDMATLLKFGDFDWDDNSNINSFNIGYFLARMNFKITYFGQEIGGNEEFAKDPEKYFKDRNIEYCPDLTIKDIQNTYKKMKQEKNISFVEDPNFDLFELIKHKQHRSTLFLLGGDFYTMRGEERPKDVGFTGHYVVCSGIRDGKFIIHDPGPDIKLEYLVEPETMYKSMKYYGEKEITCMMIEYV
ncbi:hypothetical protein DLH72_04305 [Candidatus Gracilibacteria bacterium]|nr:MAG: hypothetical protein DLH72_04305 [Candidatus Gracilibacteria bacterium]